MMESNTSRTPQTPQTSAPGTLAPVVTTTAQGNIFQALYRLISPSRATQLLEQDKNSPPNSDRDVSVTSDQKTPADELENFRHTAHLVDRYMDAKHVENMRNKVRREKEHLNPSISPENPHWIEIREKLMIALKSNSIYNILHDTKYNFTEEDILLFVPPSTEGALLDLQRKNTVKYQKNIGPGGRFEGQNDNVITKLAMLYFGLPVEPLTERNCINAGIDEVDKPDDPKELPRVQRIIYAEKPLEFLDLYHERAYGFPTLRRPKPRRVIGAKNRPTFLPRAKRDKHLRDSRLGSGILPRTGASKKVIMRGGAGSSVDLAEFYSSYQPNLRGGGDDTERVDDFWLYCSLGSVNKKIKLAEEAKKDDPEDFKRKALFLLGLSDTGEWNFHVDQYRNQGDHKKSPRKEFVKTFNVNQRTYKDRYRQYLKARLYNPLGDWPMFVRPMGTPADESISIEDYEETKYRAAIDLIDVKEQQKWTSSSALSPEKSPKKQKTKSSAKADRSPKVLLNPEAKREETPNAKSVANSSANQQTNVLQSSWRLVYPLDEAHMFAAFEDDARSFRRAVNTGVLKDVEDKSFLVSFYATQTDRPKENKIYSGTIKYPAGLADGLYKQFIRPRTFGSKHDDTVIIAHYKQEVPKYWPPGGHRLVQVSMITPKAEPRSTSVLYRQDGSSVTVLDNSFRAFSDAIREMTRRHDLVADVYSNRKTRGKLVSYDRTLDLSTENLESLYNNQISRFLFGPNTEESVVIRAKTEPRKEKWLPSQENIKSVNDDMIYIQRNTMHPIPSVQSIRSKTPPIPPSQLTRDNVPPVPPTNMKTTNLAQIFNQTGVRINKERFLRPQVKRPVPLKFDTWTQEESRLDRLRQQGYTKPQSVVEPGQKPAAPFFGPSRELALKVSSNLPTIFTQRITPTDISQLLEENVFLRNALLERRSACDLCGMSFAAYEPEQKQAHTKEHLDNLRNAGNCPLCDGDKWVFMDTQQRRQHLWEHQYVEESQIIKDFWNDLICPICDKPLYNETTEYIVRHLVQHEPNSLAYCDRCGVCLNRLTPAEIAHHDHQTHTGACQPNLSPERWSEVPEFCAICGRDKTNLTEDQKLDHQNHCIQSESFYCENCGFDMSTLDLNELNGVERHNTACKIPRGFKRKFCQRCGKNKSVMTAGELATHSDECFEGSTYLPPLENLNWRPGHNRRETTFDARERDLHRRESELARKKYTFESESRGGSAAAVGVVNSKFRIDTCPSPQCELTGDELTAMTKEEFFNHMLDHDYNAQFRCPLINIIDDTASVCGRLVTINDPSFKAHYTHKSYTESLLSPNAERLENTLRIVKDQYQTLVVAQPKENDNGKEKGVKAAKRRLQEEDGPETLKKRPKITESEKSKEAITETRRSKRVPSSAPASDHPTKKSKPDVRQVKSSKTNDVTSADELEELEEDKEPTTLILGKKRKRVTFEKSVNAPVKAAPKKKPVPKKKAVAIPKRSEGAPVKAANPLAPRKGTREQK